LTHDNTAAVINKFNKLPNKNIKFKSQPVFVLDHNVQDNSEQNLKQYKEIEDFSKFYDIDFFGKGRGIGHQVMCEEGYVWPYTLVVASDSHANMYGGLGCLGTPIVRTDAVSIWTRGETWWQIPEISKVELYNKLNVGVTGKDVITTLCGIFNEDEVLNHAIEFTGDGISNLSIDERLTISNMTTEWGCLAGIFPVDEKTIEYYKNRKENTRINKELIKNIEILKSDEGAYYSKVIKLDLNRVTQTVSGPNHVKIIQSVSEIEKKKN